MKPFNLRRLTEELSDWVSSPQNKEFCYFKEIDRIQSKLQMRSPFTGGIKVDLDMLGLWLNSTGALQVLNGDPTGWNRMALGLCWRMWGLRIYGAYQDSGHPCNFTLLNQVVVYLCHAIVVKHDAFVDWQARHAISSLAEGRNYYGLWDETPFEPFAFKLYALWRRFPLSYERRNVHSLDVYQDILDSWNDVPRLQSALIAACDYHVRRSSGNGGYPEFDWAPYDVFPVEILAIQRIRRDMGLPMPEIDHPLMQQPLAHPPDEWKVASDPPTDALLEQVIAKARAELPIGDPW